MVLYKDVMTGTRAPTHNDGKETPRDLQLLCEVRVV